MGDELATQLSEIRIKTEVEDEDKEEEIKEQTVKRDEKIPKRDYDGRESRRQRKSSEEDAVVLETGVKGHVKWYNVWHHYGFIGRDDNPGTDVFVHQSGIMKSRTMNPLYRTLDMNEEVVFDVVAGKGEMKKAINVTGPNGSKVRGCFFFEQYIRNCGFRDQRRFMRNDGRSRPVRRWRNPRKSLDGEEKPKKRNSEKSSEENENNKPRKHKRAGSDGLKEKKRGSRRRHAESTKENKIPKGEEKEPELTGTDINAHVENEINVTA